MINKDVLTTQDLKKIDKMEEILKMRVTLQEGLDLNMYELAIRLFEAIQEIDNDNYNKNIH